MYIYVRHFIKFVNIVKSLYTRQRQSMTTRQMITEPSSCQRGYSITTNTI